MFEAIYELPTQVRSSLDEQDQTIWLREYNKCKPKTEEDCANAKKRAWMACRTLPSSFSFHIKASVEKVDNSQEVVNLQSIKETLDSFIAYGGNVQYEHGNYNVACIWAWDEFEEDGAPGVAVWGNVFGGDKVYDTMRRGFIEGRNSVSIGGEASNGKYTCDSRGCYVRKDLKQLLEISLCKVPVNKYATMIWYNENAKLTKSNSEDDLFKMAVSEYEIHRDYTTCPIQKLKKSMSESGLDAHATYDGVSVEVSKEEFDEMKPLMKAANICGTWKGGYALLNYAEEYIEKTFKEGLKKGYISPAGKILDSIPREVFEDMHEKELLNYNSFEIYLKTPDDFNE